MSSLWQDGHIRPKCYDLLYSNPTTQNDVKIRVIWVKKSDLRCHVVHIALQAQQSNMWYFDSGCSRHMSGDKSLFTTLEHYVNGIVTFGDRYSTKVTTKETVEPQACLG